MFLRYARFAAVFPLFLLAVAATPQQQNGPEMTQQESAPTFESRVNLVLVPVIVRDKQGNAVTNLGKDDFQILDKGKAQTITSFTVQKRGNAAVAAAANNEPTVANREGSAAVAVAAPERYVAYVFDDLSINASDLILLKKAASAHLAKSLQPADRAAIYTTSGRNNLDFTDDKEKLQDALSHIQRQMLYQHVGHQCPDLTYYWADLIVNKNDSLALTTATQETLACANFDPSSQTTIAQQMATSAAQQELAVGEQSTRVILSVIQAIVRRMGAAPGQRQIVIASPGFLTLSSEAVSEKADILNAATHANIMISGLNARGLYTPGPDASEPGTYSPTSQAQVDLYQNASSQAAEDVLAEFAEGTGGMFFHNSNDLAGGFDRIAAAPEVTYVLGFTPLVMKPDGAFHRLRINLVNRKGLEIQARRGYYSLKHTNDAEENAKADIHDALFSRDELHDIPIDLQTQFFKTGENDAKLTVVAKVDLRRLRFGKQMGAITINWRWFRCFSIETVIT